MGNGVTIIVGAGAVLDFDHKDIFPSVNNNQMGLSTRISHSTLEKKELNDLK